MKCPFCGEIGDKVVDSRMTKRGETVRRRRKCLSCDNKFTTHENIKELTIQVIKKDGRKETFDREKIKNGMHKARKKLDISSETINKIVKNIEFEIKKSRKKNILSKDIGEKVMKKLYDLNDIAYVRFASVYREFRDVEDFFDELKNLLEQK